MEYKDFIGMSNIFDMPILYLLNSIFLNVENISGIFISRNIGFKCFIVFYKLSK